MKINILKEKEKLQNNQKEFPSNNSTSQVSKSKVNSF